MSDHHENPFDHPHAWIQEETLADIRLDALVLADAPDIGRRVFRDACAAYSSAVAEQAVGWDQQPAVAAAGSVVVTATPMATREGATQPGLARPNTLAVANGPDWSVALVLAGGLKVVQIS